MLTADIDRLLDALAAGDLAAKGPLVDALLEAGDQRAERVRQAAPIPQWPQPELPDFVQRDAGWRFLHQDREWEYLGRVPRGRDYSTQTVLCGCWQQVLSLAWEQGARAAPAVEYGRLDARRYAMADPDDWLPARLEYRPVRQRRWTYWAGQCARNVCGSAGQLNR